jgi:hypothetical protein
MWWLSLISSAEVTIHATMEGMALHLLSSMEARAPRKCALRIRHSRHTTSEVIMETDMLLGPLAEPLMVTTQRITIRVKLKKGLSIL